MIVTYEYYHIISRLRSATHICNYLCDVDSYIDDKETDTILPFFVALAVVVINIQTQFSLNSAKKLFFLHSFRDLFHKISPHSSKKFAITSYPI